MDKERSQDTRIGYTEGEKKLMSNGLHRIFTSRSIKKRLAKLTVAALLLQYVPMFSGGQSTALADWQETKDAPISVTEQTYSNGSDTRASLQQFTAAKALSSKLTDYTWERVTLNLSPNARQAAAMVYDEKAGNVVMFGGQGNSGSLDETWIWDGRQKTWREILNLSVKPSKRKSAVMAYDPVSEKVLLFGGEGQAGVLGDTWLWNGINAKWEQVTGLASAPSARAGSHLAYDGEQLVLFGGYTGSGNSKTRLDDTWLWNGTSWTEVHPDKKPPAAHSGQMAYDGYTAVLYGGNTGAVTQTYVGNTATQTITHDDSSPLLWKWDRAAQTWSSVNGPEAYGRWGQAMAYDGRRVVFFGGERDYVHMYNAVLVPGLKLPSTTYPAMNGSHVYGWTGSGWEFNPLNMTMETVYQNDDGYKGKVLVVPNQVPVPLTYANLAFDGKNFVMFGGSRNQINIMDKVFGKSVGSMPAGNVNETWIFGFTPPTAPGVKLAADPIVNYDPQRINDTVSVVTSVYDDGTRTITSRGVEYRPYSESEQSAWTNVPYTGSSPQGTGSFTVQVNGLTWHQEYEVRGYAVNEMGISYTETKRVAMKDDPNMTPPDVDYDRVGASVLHVKDKKRLVAVGTGVTNLLRKPLEGIHYSLQSQDGTSHALSYNILNDSQLELTWSEELAPGKYTVRLEHDFYEDYVFTDGLMITALDFYKPRNFASVDVPSTSASNAVNSLVLHGPFTEDPSAPKVYVLNDLSEPVSINESLMFKGTRLVVDKSSANGKSVIQGEGRLYVNGGAAGANVSYIIQDRPFTLSSDSFSIALNDGEAADYLNLGMPVTASSLTFTANGLQLTGDLEIGLQVGNQKVTDKVSVDDLTFRNNRFELFGTYEMSNSFKVGPLQASNTEFVLDSRLPYVGMTSQGSLPDTNISFDLYMKTKHGRLDGISFGMYRKAKLASTGLQVNYLFGSVDKLAEKTQIPQKFSVTGSVMDVIVPELKHPQVNYKFNLLGTDAINTELTSYGFSASGTEYYYWLPVNNMSMQAVVNPAKAGLKGISAPGFTASGDINVFEVIKGAIGTYSFNQKGFAGIIKGTVYVPKGIPRIGGATVRNVVLSVNDKGIYGTFKHNGIGANVKYTFNNNTILFEVEAEPPKKSWWDKAAGFINNVSDFMDAAEPWLELAEELFLAKPDSGKQVTIASVDPLKRVFDLKPVSISFQPEDTAIRDAKARIEDGQFTSVDRTPSLNAEANAVSGEVTTRFALDRSYDALVLLTGDQRNAAVSVSTETGAKIVLSEVHYDAVNNMTLMRQSLYPGDWSIVTKGSTRISIHELLFVNNTLTLAALTEQWVQAPDRLVTSLVIAERGSYVLKVGPADGEVIVYKPDGRPYSLQTEQQAAGWNAFKDAGGNLYALLDAAEAGTWMISASSSPEASLSSVPAKTTTGEIAQWVQELAFPAVFSLDRTSNGQAVVEIYGADAHTKLVTPKGALYPLQKDPSQPGMNAVLDESQQKLTVLLHDVDLQGQWTAVSSNFTSVIAYQSSRKFKSIKPLFMEGRHTKLFELSEKGDYMLTISGGDASTLIIAPNGEEYKLKFDAPSGNAYLQPAADRVLSTGGNSDPLQQTQVATPHPVNDGRDMLYVSLLDASAGSWKIQSAKKVELQIQKLLPQTAIHVSAASVSGEVNRVNVTWSMDNAASDAIVSLMLTDQADQYIGEVIAEGMPASGSTIIDIPAWILPGTYYLSAAGVSGNDVPVYAAAEETVEVTAPYSLAAPGKPEVLSTGNGEISLRFPQAAGDITSYRIWVSEAGSGSAAQPMMDLAPQQGEWQEAVISGLSVNASYILAVSALGQQQGQWVWSPKSESVITELAAPQPATLTLSLDAGANTVSERGYTALDGTEEMMLVTAAEQALLQVTSNQVVSLSLFVNGELLDSNRLQQGQTYEAALHELLQVSVLKERDYNVRIEAVNERGDRSMLYRKLYVDRTGPMLIVSGSDDAALNGTVTTDSKLYITGRTDAGAKLVINDTVVPLDDEGRFVYYAPLHWNNQTDRQLIKITAVDGAGNKTEHGFEVLRGANAVSPEYPGDLAALTVTGAKLDAHYQFGTVSYQALAYSEKVRIYAVSLDNTSSVTINGKALSQDGYVDVEVPAAGRTVSIQVIPAGGSAKQYTMQLDGKGSSEAVLRAIKLYNAKADQSGEALPAQPFIGTEQSYTVYVDHEVDSITLSAEALKAGSAVQVDGQAVQSGKLSQKVSLQIGENRISVVVTSPDGSVTRSYQVIAVREQSNNAQLQELQIAASGAALEASYIPADLIYRVFVPYEAQELLLRPVAEHADAVIRIDGKKAASGIDVAVPFTQAAQTVAIEVTAQDGTVLAYTVSALRQQASPSQPPLLEKLDAGIELAQAYSPYKFNYKADKAVTRRNLTVTAEPNDPNAMVSIGSESKQGGGSFSVVLERGMNTIIVRVEAADFTSSQTYSIDVERRMPSENPNQQVRQITISGDTGSWTDQTSIERTRTDEGRMVDSVKLDAGKAQAILTKAEQSKDNTARIYVSDLPDAPADEQIVSLSKESMAVLATGGMSVQVELPNAQITLPASSLQQFKNAGEEAYFRIVPIRAEADRSELSSRVLTAELVQSAAGGRPVTVVGQPVKIETNYSGYKTELVFPIQNLELPDNAAQLAQVLSELAVYIEHSDGDKKLVRGEIRYDAAGKPAGIAIEIDKFSTFTIIRTNGAEVLKVLEPYISGYPDGTFRPAQVITRAELASILYRVGARSSISVMEQASEAAYPDVADGHWAADAIAGMPLAGLMLGDSAGLFRPDDAVTRGELASIAARLLPADSMNGVMTSEFSDTQQHWAYEAIKQASQAGILQGYPDGQFRPDQKLSRAEAVTVLNRLFDRPVSGALLIGWPDVAQDHWAAKEIQSASSTVKLMSDGSVHAEPGQK